MNNKAKGWLFLAGAIAAVQAMKDADVTADDAVPTLLKSSAFVRQVRAELGLANLFAHHARPFDFLQPAVSVGDLPVTGHQLQRPLSAVLDLDVVGPQELVVLRRALLVDEHGPDTDDNAVGFGLVWIGARHGLRP